MRQRKAAEEQYRKEEATKHLCTLRMKYVTDPDRLKQQRHSALSPTSSLFAAGGRTPAGEGMWLRKLLRARLSPHPTPLSRIKNRIFSQQSEFLKRRLTTLPRLVGIPPSCGGFDIRDLPPPGI